MLLVNVERAINRAGFNIWVMDERVGSTLVAKPLLLEFEDLGENYVKPEPTFFIAREEFYQLLKAVPMELELRGFIPRPNFAEGELKSLKEANEFNQDVAIKLLEIVKNIASNALKENEEND